MSAAPDHALTEPSSQRAQVCDASKRGRSRRRYTIFLRARVLDRIAQGRYAPHRAKLRAVHLTVICVVG
jgi:hypothetical protein